MASLVEWKRPPRMKLHSGRLQLERLEGLAKDKHKT
jgi:hypothetical protein